MRSITRHIPNFFSILNLLSGMGAVIAVLNGSVSLFLYFLIACLAFDFFDGLSARMFNAGSEVGKQLDSLSDMVSFGVLPGIVMYVLLKNGYTTHYEIETDGFQWLALPAFLITACSALRLARFNLDEDGDGWFTGLATPSNTFFIAGLLFIAHYGSSVMADRITEPLVLLAITLVFSWLLISPIKMFNVKLKPGDRPGNIKRGIAMTIGIVGLIILKEYGPSVMVVLYILYNLGEQLFISGKNTPGD